MTPNRELSCKTAENLTLVRERRPLVHNITNYVVMNYTANALLACGASPVMAHAEGEVEEMVSLASALVLNIGTLSEPWVHSMVKAGKAANRKGVPVVLDPVGAGATRLRTEAAKRILGEVRVKVVRGNASEVLSLAAQTGGTKGVDSIHGVDEAADAATTLASQLGATLAITGVVDLVTDGRSTRRVFNGHELMGRVTGTGCTSTALVGAFLGVDPNPVAAAATALGYFGLAGELASQTAAGPGSFQIALLDALYNLDAEQLISGVRIEGEAR